MFLKINVIFKNIMNKMDELIYFFLLCNSDPGFKIGGKSALGIVQ